MYQTERRCQQLFCGDFPKVLRLTKGVHQKLTDYCGLSDDVVSHDIEIYGYLCCDYGVDDMGLITNAFLAPYQKSTGITSTVDPEIFKQVSPILSDKGYEIIGFWHKHPENIGVFFSGPDLRNMDSMFNHTSSFLKCEGGDLRFAYGMTLDRNGKMYAHTICEFGCGYKPSKEALPKIVDGALDYDPDILIKELNHSVDCVAHPVTRPLKLQAETLYGPAGMGSITESKIGLDNQKRQIKKSTFRGAFGNPRGKSVSLNEIMAQKRRLKQKDEINGSTETYSTGDSDLISPVVSVNRVSSSQNSFFESVFQEVNANIKKRSPDKNALIEPIDVQLENDSVTTETIQVESVKHSSQHRQKVEVDFEFLYSSLYVSRETNVAFETNESLFRAKAVYEKECLDGVSKESAYKIAEIIDRMGSHSGEGLFAISEMIRDTITIKHLRNGVSYEDALNISKTELKPKSKEYYESLSPTLKATPEEISANVVSRNDVVKRSRWRRWKK